MQKQQRMNFFKVDFNFCLHELHSDNATYFTSFVMQELCCKFGITQTFKSSFHANRNGQVERLMQTVTTSLRSELHNTSKTNKKYL